MLLSAQTAALIALAIQLTVGGASPVLPPQTTKRQLAPTVTLDDGTFQGTSDLGVSRFLGIPYALPPTGGRRFALPEANAPYSGTHQATGYGPPCVGQHSSLDLPAGPLSDALSTVSALLGTLGEAAGVEGEDCLTVNVIKPSSASSSSKLPVVVWIYGGGFSGGSTSMYDGSGVVSRSIALNMPAIYVSMNYRLSAFGFLGGAEVKAAGVGNLGLQDQRLALRWVHKYIASFGGDPDKVTIWGESAGAISVALQMVTNGGNTEGLFRAAFMQSGSPVAWGNITKGQPYYDSLVQMTGCQGAADTLTCLRGVSYAALTDAINDLPGVTSYESFNIAFGPRTDGVFFSDVPTKLVLQGSVANIPFVTGDCDDEGTQFGPSTLNITTTAQLRTYFHDNYLPQSQLSEVDSVLTSYPDDGTQGSPFDTGILNEITPQYKRIAAILSDLAFQGPRRAFLNELSSKQNTWAYLSKRLKVTPLLGAFHGSDLLNSYGNGELTDYLVRFVTNLDPNVGAGTHVNWPKYDTTTRQLVTFIDSLLPPAQTITADTFRQGGMDLLNALSNQYTL